MALSVQSVPPIAPSATPVTSLPSALRTSRPMTANPTRSTEVKFVVDWNNPATSTSSTKPKASNDNLQEAFRHFREQRMDEMRLQQRLEATRKKKIRRSDPARMHRLRLKFVEQAKKYLGVPYAKKYFEAGTPEYESKLFLDCCGLVRRVMYDLSKDFGFVIGPWNQSYMFDTLSRTVTHLSDVQPGDLVFISATYYNPKMKKQRHNLTHVEIMLGDGEKTIGARWNDGKVQFFDSYKFTSKSYHSQIYTIKSLDPWLKGICKSYCSEHFWRRRRPNKVNKKSIFYPSDQPRKEHRHRVHSSKPSKGTSGSSTSSVNSSNKKSEHRRKRKRRTKRSKSSHRRSSSAKPLVDEETVASLTNEQIPPLVSPLDIQLISGDEQSMENLADHLADLTCQDEQEECDDSDSLDDALDAEQLDDDNEDSLNSSSAVINIQ